MKISLMWPLVMAGQMMVSPAFGQGSGKDVRVVRIGGPSLGVRLEEVDAGAVARLKLKEEKGALVTEVLGGSAAEKAGLKKDDVILRFQGEAVLTAAQLTRIVRDVPAGRKVDIDVVRRGAPITVTATLERGDWSGDERDMADFGALREKLGTLGDLGFKSREGQMLPRMFNFKIDEDGPGLMASGGKGRLGITYTEIEGQLAEYFKAPRDTAILVNSVASGSAAEKAGIRAGDLLTKLGERTLREGPDLQGAVSDLSAGQSTPLTVWRDGKAVDLRVTVEGDKTSRTQTPRRRRPVS